MKEYILCAAIWYKDIDPIRKHPCVPINAPNGVVLCGWRHGNIIAQMTILEGLRTVTNGENSVGDYEQGFLTNLNRFVDRKEAMIIAKSANQLIRTPFGEELYSEDLY